MDFIQGRDMIREVVSSDRSNKRKNFIIHQILWSVAGESFEMANALIRHFDLFMFDCGAMTWFDGRLAKDTRPLVAVENIVMIGDKNNV